MGEDKGHIYPRTSGTANYGSAIIPIVGKGAALKRKDNAMMVLDSKVDNAVYTPDFGRIEAQVSLLIKTRAGQAPHWIHVRTSQPKDGATPVESRLIADAICLAQSLRMGGVAAQEQIAA